MLVNSSSPGRDWVRESHSAKSHAESGVFNHQESDVVIMLADVVKTEGHGEPAVPVVHATIKHFPGSSRQHRPDSTGLTFSQVGILTSWMARKSGHISILKCDDGCQYNQLQMDVNRSGTLMSAAF
jgi:hypothetical protein